MKVRCSKTQNLWLNDSSETQMDGRGCKEVRTSGGSF